MKLLAFAAFMLVACNLKKDVFAQIVEVVTYISAENQRFQCNISGSGAVQWIDQANDPIVPIISYIPSTGSETVESTDEKYDNFAFEALESFYDLVINNVGKDDDGSYGCSLTPGGLEAAYRVIVEVPTDSISLSCSSCTEANSACDCECLASGGFSPSLLSLEWKINDIALPIQPPTVTSTDSGQTTYSSDAVVTVEQDDSVVTCTVTGFENQDDIARQFPSALVAEQTLSSPDCIVSVNNVNCPTVVLSCSCEAYPVVPDGPEYISYYARQGPEDTGNDTLLPSPSYDTTAGSDTYFICSGDNGLNFGRKSEAIPNPCTEATTTEPSDTTDKNGPNGTDDGVGAAPIGAIVGGVIAGCVVVAVIVIIIIVILKKRGNGVEGKSNDNTDGNGVNAKLASSPPEPTEPAEYASVNKPKSQPQAAPRSSAPPEKMELQYADLDHGNRGQSNEVRQPTNEPTEYATVQSVIV